MRLLIIEDDPIIGRNLKSLLTAEAFAVDLVSSGQSGLDKAGDEDYDLIIVDWMLPDLDGPTICRRLREDKRPTAILMLTARSQTADTVQGLGSGADDYLTKPFAAQELIARVKALARRRHLSITSPIIKIKDLTIDTNTNQVARNGRLIELSPKEFNLLRFLASQPGFAFDRTTLLSHAWDEQADLFSNTVDVHIRYLRRKIDDPYPTKLIHTVKGKGYMLCGD